MQLKFYLNKFLKVDNIENYTLDTLYKLRENYDEFLDNSDGMDPDFPLVKFNGKGKKIGGNNVYKAMKDGESFEEFEERKNRVLGNPMSISKEERKEHNIPTDELRKHLRQSREGQKKRNK